MTIIYTDGKYDCASNPGDTIDAEPVEGGLLVTFGEDNQPVEKYQVQGHLYNGGYNIWAPWNWTDVPGGDVESFTLNWDLEYDRTYAIAVRTVTDSRPCYAYSFEWLLYVTPADPNIDAVTGLSAALAPNQSGKATLTWNDPNDSTLSYDIQYQKRSQSGWNSITPDPAPSASGGKFSATVSGLATCSSYKFRVRARRSSNPSIYAETAGYLAMGGTQGTENADTLNGDGGDDCLYGFDGDDTLNGNGGDDRLNGGPGADALRGGAGLDTADYQGSDAAVTVDLSSTSTQSGGHAEGDTLASIENIIGSAHDDTLTGDDSDNAFKGGPGADTLDGGDGNDTADYSGTPPTIVKAGYWTVTVGVTVNLATGNHKRGHAQGDTLTNIENITGSGHPDHITGDAASNIIRGHGGGDILFGGAGDDTLYGGGGFNIMYGDDGDDTLYGGAYDDWLHGEGGNDTLRGGPGLDRFMFRMTKGIGHDVIEDYTLSEELMKSEVIHICNKLGGPRHLRIHQRDVGSDHVITIEVRGQPVSTITLKGITSSSPNFDNLAISRSATATGACWSGPEYPEL